MPISGSTAAFLLERPTPFEFHKSAIENAKEQFERTAPHGCFQSRHACEPAAAAAMTSTMPTPSIASNAARKWGELNPPFKFN
jgi:hypothetical protein